MHVYIYILFTHMNFKRANSSIEGVQYYTVCPMSDDCRLPGASDVYTWGDNSNYTLGQENEQKRRNPECVELFRKKQLSIEQVRMH